MSDTYLGDKGQSRRIPLPTPQELAEEIPFDAWKENGFDLDWMKNLLSATVEWETVKHLDDVFRITAYQTPDEDLRGVSIVSAGSTEDGWLITAQHLRGPVWNLRLGPDGEVDQWIDPKDGEARTIRLK